MNTKHRTHIYISVKARFKPYRLDFKRPSGTSRGVLKTKDSWVLILEDMEARGYGECSVIRGLSPDLNYDITERIALLCEIINSVGPPSLEDPVFANMPALKFCYEMALRDLKTGGQRNLFETDFLKGKGIHINGLVWMGEPQYMIDQIKDKIEQGYSCIKIKVAAIEFHDECEVLKHIRREYDPRDIEIRLDANGGFAIDDAKEKLKRLAEFNIHSIEQPIAVQQWDQMSDLCEAQIIDIALDEELIGVTTKNKAELLEIIRPQYIILKPSLLGGFSQSQEWIDLANKVKIGWWVTSALESNIGLNAIAQWTATLNSDRPQGLGTGQLFTNNIDAPLYIKEGHLFYGDGAWSLNPI